MPISRGIEKDNHEKNVYGNDDRNCMSLRAIELQYLIVELVAQQPRLPKEHQSAAILIVIVDHGNVPPRTSCTLYSLLFSLLEQGLEPSEFQCTGSCSVWSSFVVKNVETIRR